MKQEFDVEFEWLGYELFPEGMDFPTHPPASLAPDRPARPSRLDLAFAAEGLPHPTAQRPTSMRTHNAHEAVEHAKTVDAGDRLLRRLYEAYYVEGKNINDLDVIAELSDGIVDDVPALSAAVREGKYAARVVPFDEPANANGVYYVPTFWIGDNRYSEQPYTVLRQALVEATQESPSFYNDLSFPPPPDDRPYLLINMVATIDGKTVSGGNHESVLDLGSKLDHATMHRIERQVDAVMIGAGTLRASPPTWRPRAPVRVVATTTGDIPWNAAFLNQDASRSFIVRPADTSFPIPERIEPLAADICGALELLRRKHGIRRILVEGGSELNAQLIALGLADELFLTVEPKVKLGRETKTYAGGDPLPRESMQKFELVEEHRAGNEMFLRYRRR